MKTFVTLFYLGLNNTHLTKDVGLIPFYMHKYQGYLSYIVSPDNNNEYIDKREGVDIKSIKGFHIGLFHIGLIKYLVNNSKKIDVLNLYHFYPWSLFYGFIYKIFNKTGKIYLKLDQDIEIFKNRGNKIYNFGGLINALLKPFENFFIKICDIISIEQLEGVALFNEYNNKFTDKLIGLIFKQSAPLVKIFQL